MDVELEVCTVTEAMCTCTLPDGHDGPHVCTPDCNGSWDFDERGAFVVVRLPGVQFPGVSR